MVAVQKNQTLAVKALCEEFKCDKNAQDMVRDACFFFMCVCIATVHWRLLFSLCVCCSCYMLGVMNSFSNHKLTITSSSSYALFDNDAYE